MIRCNEVARLLSTEQLEDQHFSTRIQVRLHLWMCVHCRRFERQIRQLGAAIRSLLGSTEATRPGGELEERVLRKLSTK